MAIKRRAVKKIVTGVKKAAKPAIHVTHTSVTHAHSGAAVVQALITDAPAMQQLAQALKGLIVNQMLIGQLVNAVEAMITQANITTPGRVLAGTIITGANALVLNGSSAPIKAMVKINAAATATSVYVPTYLRASIAAGQDVWIMPMNGNMSDLMILALRNVF